MSATSPALRPEARGGGTVLSRGGAPRGGAGVGRSLLGRVGVRLAVIFVAVAWSVPTAGLLISSLRPENDIRNSGWWTVLLHPFEATTSWTLANYERVLSAEGLLDAFINSVVVTIPAVVMPITIAAYAAHAFAWIRFPGRSILFAIVVALLVVPIQMSLVPVLRMYGALELNGTLLGVWLAHTAFGLPLAIFLLYNYISQLPGDLFESAAIDGASHAQIFRSIVIPLSVPALASFAIFQFLWVWNDLLVALVYLGTNDAVQVMPSQLAEMVGTRGEAWHVLTAGAFVTMVVPLVVFLLLQRYFVRGIVTGSVKG